MRQKDILFLEHFLVELIMPQFEIVSDFRMTGDQPQAVAILPPSSDLSLEEKIKPALQYFGGK